jgi:Flp pilus assembly protein TadG
VRKRLAARSGAPAEEGVVLVLVAFMLTAMIAVAAIVIDLGQGYVTARRMQNAADAAALAATRALDRVKLGMELPAAVDSAARLIATANGSDDALVACIVTDWQGAPLGPCADPAAVTNTKADGVRVGTGTSWLATFAVVGPAAMTLTVSRSSAATVQPLTGQDSPLLACAFGQSDGRNPQPDLLTGSPGHYTVNPSAVGRSYLLHDPQVALCGLASPSWKGDAGPGPFNLPGWLPVTTGDKAGPIRSQIAGETVCGSAMYVGCALVVPICDRSNGGSGSNGQLYCDTFGAFELVAQSSNSQTFRFLGRATVANGQGGDGAPGPDDVRVVKLIT